MAAIFDDAEYRAERSLLMAFHDARIAALRRSLCDRQVMALILAVIEEQRAALRALDARWQARRQAVWMERMRRRMGASGPKRPGGGPRGPTKTSSAKGRTID